MRSYFTRLILAMLLLSAIQNVRAQNLVYYNAFNQGESSWRNYDDQLSNALIRDGKYILTHKQHTSTVIALPINVDPNRDFALQTVMSHVNGTSLYPAGLTFFGSNSLNLYYFGISNTGQFQIGSFTNGANRIIANWTASPAILINAPNKLRVEKHADMVKFFVNDTQVYQMPPPLPFGNAFGLTVMEQQSDAFDYLKLVYIDKKTVSNVPAISASLKRTVYHTDFNADDSNQWVLPATDSLTTVITDGYFKMIRRARLGFNLSVSAETLQLDMHRDFLIETEAIHYGGMQNFGYGLEFGCGAGETYHFWIAAAGFYTIGKTTAQGYNNIQAWTLTDLVNKGDLSKNKLTLVHKNGQLGFYINDQLATTYPDIAFQGSRFGLAVSASQNVGFNYFTAGYLDDDNAVINRTVNTAPPEIYVTSPEVTRGLKVVQSSENLHVAGIARSQQAITSVRVNNIEAKVDANGTFAADVPMAVGDNTLLIEATDASNNKGQYKFNVVRNQVTANTAANVKHDAAQGKFYALLIGVQNYNDQSIPSLEGPVGDATSLMQALAANYTFSNENITLLKDPTRAQFFSALDAITAKITPEDNLLIFYAGHGYYDDSHMQGYWFPSDAVRTRRDTWISNADLIDYITAIKSKHTMLISDACFAGSIFKTRAIEMAPKDIQEVYKLPSRKAMTSGAMKEVPDKSVFMKYLLERLNQNTEQFLPAEQLFSSFKAAVINNSPNGQVPQFGEIREAGDEGGDFVFIRKN